METFETIKKFLDEGGKCLLIEDGKPIGVVLTMEEYEQLRHSPKGEVGVPTEASGLLIPDLSAGASAKEEINSKPVAVHPIGEAIVKEMDFGAASANIDEINFADADDVTLEDLGLDELPY